MDIIIRIKKTETLKYTGLQWHIRKKPYYLKKLLA